MIQIIDCRIDQDGQKMIIEAQVDTQSYYQNVFIDALIIDTDKTYIENGPSSNPIFVETYEDNSSIIKTNSTCNKVNVESSCKCGDVFSDEKTRHINRIITAQELGLDTLNNNMFFIYIKTQGYPDPSTPCSMDKEYSISVVYNLKPFYCKAMNYIKSIDCICEDKQQFIQFILQEKVFDLALRTGNFFKAIEYWNKFFANKSNVTTKNCGCHGVG